MAASWRWWRSWRVSRTSRRLRSWCRRCRPWWPLRRPRNAWPHWDSMYTLYIYTYYIHRYIFNAYIYIHYMIYMNIFIILIIYMYTEIWYDIFTTSVNICLPAHGDAGEEAGASAGLRGALWPLRRPRNAWHGHATRGPLGILYIHTYYIHM